MDLTAKLEGDSVPEKFRGKTVADLLNSYGELETRLGQPPKPAPQARSRELTSTPLGIPQNANESPFDPFVEEIERTGKLSPESRAYMQSQGVPARTIDIFEAGAIARSKETQQAVYETVGSKEAYDSMIQWAATLPPTRQQAFNEAISSPNPEVRALAVRGLHSEFVATNGQPPASPVKPGAGAPAHKGFDRFSDLTAAQKDPRYASNEEGFRDQTIARARAARQAGVEGFV